MFSHRILLPILMSKMALEGTPPPTWVGSGGAGPIVLCDSVWSADALQMAFQYPRDPPGTPWTTFNKHSVCSRQSISPCWWHPAWHPGWRAHREAAVDVQSYFSTTGSPRKDKEIGEVDRRENCHVRVADAKFFNQIWIILNNSQIDIDKSGKHSASKN